MKLFHERRVQWTALAGGAPALAIAIVLLIVDGHSPKTQWTFGLLAAGGLLWAAGSVREQVTGPLRTIANLLEAMREGDYSIRARNPQNEDALGDVMLQVNAMSSTLRAQRLGAMEATALLRKVMEEINVAVFAFDSAQKLKLVNRAGERLLAQPAERLLGRAAASFQLDDLLSGTLPTIQRDFPGGSGRWGISCSSYREEGLPLQLLVLTDVTRALREEELLAWQRLVRVLGHELNNSLTPIKSLAGSLESIARQEPLPEDWRDDMIRGLSIIASRSDSLSRFIGAYARFARLPSPTPGPVPLKPLIERVAMMETRLRVRVDEGPGLLLQADAAQLEQVLINLIRNGADAATETGGGVAIGWSADAGEVEIRVTDDGPGLASSANLFVPFFTTKPGGSGIGLVISRQIAEAHGGTLQLENRIDGPGCIARLLLPLAA